MGTPGYTSPEQLRGEKISGRSDQFGLAVMTYRALTGKMPFQAASLATLFFQIAQMEAEDICRLNPSLVPQADLVVRKAMAKLPDQRFTTCVEFIDALRTALNVSAQTTAEPPKTEPPPPPLISEERFRSPKWAVAFFAL